jgi:hypothetical protein
MTNWLHKFLNPHCSHCKEEHEDSKVCSSCETLRQQLAITNVNIERLMNRLLEKPIVEAPHEFKEVSQPKNIPWNVRRQMLETEDRERAKLINAAPVAQHIPTEDLEKDLKIATAQRENSL